MCTSGADYPTLLSPSAGSPMAPTASLRPAAIKVPISFISGPAIRLLSRLPNSHTSPTSYSDFINSSSIPIRATSQIVSLTHECEALRRSVPASYHDYLGVFSKSKGATFPPRRTYDCRIELEDSATPPFGPIDSLSDMEQLALRNCLDNNPANYFIRPSQSPSGAPLLFIQKKDSSHRLGVESRGLNRIRITTPCSTVCVRRTSSRRSTYGKPTTSSAPPKKTNGRLLSAPIQFLRVFKLCSRALRISNLNSNFYKFHLTMRLQGPKYQL